MAAREFAQASHPHSWMLVADNLYEQSISLYRHFPAGKTTQMDGSGIILGEWPSSSRSTFLLAGFALENAIKAFLVYENPHWVSNGALARPLRSHKLVALSQQSTLIPWQKRGPAILSRFEHGLESWARYPCALSATETEAEQNLPPALWASYLELMRAYGKALMALLKSGWIGPHGVSGHFEFHGSYLGAQPSQSFKPMPLRGKA
ncbi:MAG TPA: hypothetical protein VK652_09630 [Steroidobacteraceae bacterium]|nr:hypothetical protein [Steroidobacteraceae bacterium]